MGNEYDLGDVVEVEFIFGTADNVRTNPTTVVITVKPPAASEVVNTFGGSMTYTITNPDTGRYVCTIPANAAGQWWVTGVGTGAVAAAERRPFLVKAKPY